MRNKKINKVAVLGSGIMGSRIACHFANIGVEVLLLDIVPKEGPRNSIVDTALQTAVKNNPSPVYYKKVLSKIGTGNFEDDMA
ncbi:MAG: 3-hydroxyacyl-CoA dehydrogenase NAD-binding domain-containing protein, partial [Pedobacter sp.]|uniref:3-hydroxyacyl-CoA dehydrogenase NAD-binding domain-containing protein n=1 Tax=Pedobacter sp. TaxID=1411316 RepID=UPI003568D1D7